MRRTAGEMEATDIVPPISRLECAKKATMASEPVNRAVQHAVAIVNVLRVRTAWQTILCSRSSMPAVRASLS